jgi:hypothetical protein
MRKVRMHAYKMCAKVKNKAGMFMINKPLPFLEGPESWNVYENRRVTRESWNVVDGQRDTLDRESDFLLYR